MFYDMLKDSREAFLKSFAKDVSTAKYRLGQRVKYIHPHAPNGEGEVLAVNDTGEGVEYLVSGLGCLLWESEILRSVE